MMEKMKSVFPKLNITLLLLSFIGIFLLRSEEAYASEIATETGLESELATETGLESELGTDVFALADTYEYLWDQDVSLKGLFDSASLYFQTGNWEVQEAKLELRISTSQLLNKDVSYFTIYLDGQPVDSFSLSEKERESYIHVLYLPVELLQKEGMHSITIEAYLRGQSTDACVDDSSISTWLNVYQDSKLTLKYIPLLEVVDIATFYEKFISLEALDQEKSMIATREGTSDAALGAMARILGGFGQSTVGNPELIRNGLVETVGDLKQAPYIIYVDHYDQLPAFLADQMTQDQKKMAERQAVVCLLDYESTMVLLVTGNDKEALKNAGTMLSNKLLIPTLTRTQEEVIADKDYRMESYEWEEYIPITPYGTQVKGNFEQSVSFFIEYPSNRRLAESSQLSLDYRYSANLDFDKSLVTVYIDNVPIGSRKLTKEGADNTTEVFQIPKDINVVGSFAVEIRFALYPTDDWCELTPEQIPWAYIAESSMLKWTTTENTEVFFEFYPFPFIRNCEFSETKIILPNQWTQADLEVMASMLLTMSKSVKSNAGVLDVVTTFAESDLIDYNIISIGNSKNNQMKTGARKLTGDIGNAFLDISPYSETLHAIMTVSGEEDSGMKNVLTFLGDSDNLWKLQGDLFYSNGKDFTSSYIRKPQVIKVKATLEEKIYSNENVPIVIVLSVLVLVLLSLAMLIIKYGGKNKDEK